MPQSRTADNSLLTAALNYVGRGWAVIPVHSVREGKCTCGEDNCTHPGKHPRLRAWKRYQSRRPTDADVRAWWTEWPDANLGIVTGTNSDLVVLDIDPRNGGDKTLSALLDKYGDLPTTVIASTGGGGRHILFTHPRGAMKIASKATALGPGLDIKGDGGYVVAPPSLHASGKAYEWEPRRGPDDVDAAPLPLWLLSHLDVTPDRTSRFKLPAVIEEGQRNATLFRYGRHLKSRGLDRVAIQKTLISANAKRCKPPLAPSEIEEIAGKAVTQPNCADFRRSHASAGVSPGNDAPGQALPTIVVTDREFRDIVGDALNALRAGNDPPSLFQRGGLLTRVRFDEKGTPSLDPLSPPALRNMLARVANWRRITRHGPVRVPPPNDVVQDILALSSWDNIPPLLGLVEAPTFAPDGTLLTEAGYHAGAQLWFHRTNGFTVPPVNPRPSASEIRRARDLLLTELLGDFPFDSEASQAHALAAMLLPFAREMIAGPTPLHLIDAPTAGTGKGLLADVVSMPATGRGAEVMAEGQDDEEWRKRITAVLVKGPTFIMIDNVARRLDSAALAAALTGSIWSDRVLGKTAVVTLPNRAVWMATGNNIVVSNEMARRSAWVRVDARTDMPWKRTDFRHPKLRLWVQANRGKIVHACLTLVQAWIAAGKPPGEAMLGSFEAWAETLGGILKIAGVPGFLANADQFYTQADQENQEWRAFVLKLWEDHNDGRVGTDELFEIADELATEEGLLLEVLGEGGDRSKRTRLGKALGRLRDRIFVGYRIVDEGEDNRGRKRYRLQPVEQLAKDTADVTPTSRRRSPQTSARKTSDVIID